MPEVVACAFARPDLDDGTRLPRRARENIELLVRESGEDAGHTGKWCYGFETESRSGTSHRRTKMQQRSTPQDEPPTIKSPPLHGLNVSSRGPSQPPTLEHTREHPCWLTVPLSEDVKQSNGTANVEPRVRPPARAKMPRLFLSRRILFGAEDLVLRVGLQHDLSE